MEQKHRTLACILEQQALRYGGRVFLRDKSHKNWRDHSWAEVAERAGRLRAGLHQLGLTSGDRIAILADNSPGWVEVDMAALGLGAIVVPLYTTGGIEETRHVLHDSGARLLAVDNEQRLQKICGLGSLPALETIILMASGTLARASGFQIVPLEQTTANSAMPAQPGDPDQLATFIYTSGTTGPAKGVMLSHGNIIANCESNREALELKEEDSVLSFLPVAHSFERTAGYYTVVLAGGTISYSEGLAHLAADLLEVQPSVLLAVPRVLEAVYNRVMRTVRSSSALRQRVFQVAVKIGSRAAEYRHRGLPLPPWLAAAMVPARRLVFNRIRSIFGSRLRYLISGGAPLANEINWLLAAAEIPIVEGYGLTEASPVVSCNLHGRTRIGTVGRPLKNVEVSIAADGELLVRGPNVMKGYYHREDETRQAIDPGGWLHTGDIAQLDADGYIRIIDRKKDLIVLSGGKNVSATNLENRLIADPFIAQACVVGDRRKHLAAILVPDFDALTEQPPDNLCIAGRSSADLVKDPALRDFFRRRLREFNRPLSDAERIVDFVLTEQPFSQENGELTPTLKVRRRTIQEHYRDQIEALYRTSPNE
jgi:long-chain acyl-CoA synthetase